MTKPQIVWLRRDLRIQDNPALYHASQDGPVVAVYVLDDAVAGRHQYGGASRWWLHYSLQSLQKDFGKINGKLVLRRGNSTLELCKLAEEIGAETIHANRHYEPWWRQAQGELKKRVSLKLYDGNFLLPPGSVRTRTGSDYKIYTPFAKATLSMLPPRGVLPGPKDLLPPESCPKSDRLESWVLRPENLNWANGFTEFWEIGEAAARNRLQRWKGKVDDYDSGRNFPSVEKTSLLSPHLHFGEITPVQIWHELCGKSSDGWKVYEKELIWRDYAQNVVCQFPRYPLENYRKDFDEIGWRDPREDERALADLRAWKKGKTGYPIVDAGMRQLWQTGWMHNRVRMITASFLVKHLLIDWRVGEKWFWDTLVDADYASNGANWQWVAGTGVDSNMFVRIMAPLSQSEKFDASEYIRRHIPELAHLEDPYIHDPEAFGCLPNNYPPKIVSHKEGRDRALTAYRAMKRK